MPKAQIQWVWSLAPDYLPDAAMTDRSTAFLQGGGQMAAEIARFG